MTSRPIVLAGTSDSKNPIPYRCQPIYFLLQPSITDAVPVPEDSHHSTSDFHNNNVVVARRKSDAVSMGRHSVTTKMTAIEMPPDIDEGLYLRQLYVIGKDF